MGALEIILLIAGAIILILGYVLPAKQEDKGAGTEKIAREEIKALVSEEIQDAKLQVSDMVDETVTYALEKTERSLERLSNEKIMAVNEYSDTVLQEINRNHNEVLFLYDMLNDKQQYLKNTVKEADEKVREVNKSVKKAGRAAKEAVETQKETEETVTPFRILTPDTVTVDEAYAEKQTEDKPAEGIDNHVEEPAKESVLNSNERILELHARGMDKVDIARELGLGVGEVKLVIDLFKNI